MKHTDLTTEISTTAHMCTQSVFPTHIQRFMFLYNFSTEAIRQLPRWQHLTVLKIIQVITVTTGIELTAPEACADAASWCPDIHPGQCYSEQTERDCCRTCRSFAWLNSPSCLYGDLNSWCHLRHCHTEAGGCCETCAGYRGLDGVDSHLYLVETL